MRTRSFLQQLQCNFLKLHELKSMEPDIARSNAIYCRNQGDEIFQKSFLRKLSHYWRPWERGNVWNKRGKVREGILKWRGSKSSQVGWGELQNRWFSVEVGVAGCIGRCRMTRHRTTMRRDQKVTKGRALPINETLVWATKPNGHGAVTEHT